MEGIIMDGSRFDRLVLRFGRTSTRRTLTTLAAASALPTLGLRRSEARKKKKKKCARKCATGCCTGKYGKCIQPAQQSLTQCGTDGAICRSTGCKGTCPNCGCSANTPCPTGQCCDGQGTCGACRVFFASTGHTGDFDGLTGADAFCQNLATAAGLFGTYMAWLSDTTDSPSTRFTRATVPYTLVNGTIVAANWTALTSGTLAHAIDRTESGESVGGIQAWTHTRADGTAGGVNPAGHCVNWTSSNGDPSPAGNTGIATATDASWTRFSNHTCSDDFRRIYCFQQR